MKKVLVIGMTSTAGGVESFILNYYRNIDRNELQFDFLCLNEKKVAYEDELRSLGAQVYHTVSKRENPVRQHIQLNDFFKIHAIEYVAVWANLNSLINIDFLKLAKKYGVKRIIVHSHNSANMGGMLQLVLHNINRKKILNYATDYWACSKKAAEWFYNTSVQHKVVIIKNAIDVDKNRFDEEKREKYRNRLGWADKYIIGNIGRLHFQKNQEFAIDVFSELIKTEDIYRLIIIGEGEDKEKLQNKVELLGLGDKVKFTGKQADIPGWLSCLDVFFFPSLFEGLSIVALEAQANGVPIVSSDHAIIPEGEVTGNIKKVSLNDDLGVWVSAIKNHVHLGRIPKEQIDYEFRKSGFDISVEAKKIQKRFADMDSNMI